jgi:hypothetical protein
MNLLNLKDFRGSTFILEIKNPKKETDQKAIGHLTKKILPSF